MKRRLLTLEDLLSFYTSHFSSNTTFDSSENGNPIVVHVDDVGYFEESETKSSDGLLFLKFKVCHTGINRNGSRISSNDMLQAIPSLAYRPVLAYITEDGNGELDFDGHNMEIHDDGSITYNERQVGSFTAQLPTLEYDEEQDKNYVIAYAAIPVDYTKTSEILTRKNGTKVSCEICINSMSYDAKDKVLDITDFYFNGVTLLGESVKEGMAGSRADIASLEDFSTASNSVIAQLNDLKTEVMDLKTQMTSKKGGKESVKLNELLEKYQKTIDNLNFDYESMSDEELEAKFQELFEEKPANNVVSITANGKNYTFTVSLNDKISALYSLVNDIYSEQDNTWYGVIAYDDHVVMVDYWNNRAYRQSFKEEDGVFTLTGDRVMVYTNYLTKEEETLLEKMKTSNAEMEAKIIEYEALMSDAEKEKIFNNEDYDVVRDSDEFKSLINKAAEYSVEEVSQKCNDILLDFFKNQNNFSQKKKKVHINADHTEKGDEYSPYGTLFSEFDK